jgi:hypothetical protein
MKYLVPLFTVTVIFISCKKKLEQPFLNELEYRIVNNGDSNISAFVISTEVLLPEDGSGMGPSAAFNGIRPYDTVILKVTDVTNSNKNFLNAERSFHLRVGYRQKIFSPLYFSHNFIVDGSPYAIGWTYAQNFKTKSGDTVNSLNKKIFYINWPADSAKLDEYY